MVRSRFRLLAPALIAGLALPAPLAGQSELVIIRTDEKEKVYHQAGCPSLEGEKDVLALSRAQATAKKLTQHDLCDPARPKTAREKNESITVYVDSSKYYHRKDCPKLEEDAKAAELEEAGKKLWPCPTCRPPIRKRKGPAAEAAARAPTIR